ncbi:MAG: hypothetical protein KatS3mg061_0477 [Dehalococcoidia bacterium]|nr:MAG: hypothetical protein KatS3mg061_0477 [Dehalococcoidia bacterium]
MAARTAPARPAGLRAVLFAALVGVIVAFSLTHNPLFQICTGPLVALCGPFLGGMAAAGRARTGPAEAAFYALCIAGVTVAPLVIAWLWLVFNNEIIFGPFSVPRSEAPVIGWVTLLVILYVGVTAFAGALFRAHRDARRQQAVASTPESQPRQAA